MSATKSKGIDYSGGRSNFDPKTNIHFGVINQHEVCQAWYDLSEAYYGEPHCPKCGNDAIKTADEPDEENKPETANYEIARGCCGDYMCHDCKYFFDADEAFGDEPISHYIDDEEYSAEAGEDGDIFITKSPYYTKCQYCSPCAPGAGYLMNPCEDGVKSYCFGQDWFEDGVAPYPVYRVADDTLCIAQWMKPCSELRKKA